MTRGKFSIAVLVVALLIALLPALDHDPGPRASTRAHHAHPAAQPDAYVTIIPAARPLTVPRSFFGLSTEYWSLPLYEPDDRLFLRVLSLLHVPGEGPMVLRIGGDSADHSLWEPGVTAVPAWRFRLTYPWLEYVRHLIRRAGLRVILDLNLVTGTPSRAAAWARAALQTLPHHSVVGFEVGNEPDIYSRSYWRATIAGTSRYAQAALPLDLTAAGYAHDFEAFARALSSVARHLQLIGPAVAHPRTGASWIARLIAEDRSQISMVSAHLYPLSACVPPRSPRYPTIPRLLSETTSSVAARAVRRAVELAHRAGLPFRLTELNSVTCGGRKTVSDTFATALWAPDALFELMRVGVDGVNVHVRAHTINAPFALNRHGLDARPLLYGLILFARTLGPDAQLVPARVSAAKGSDLKAWIVSVYGDQLHTLLIDKGKRPVRVDLQIPGGGSADVERLLAPSAGSWMGVTLAGQYLGRDGKWKDRLLVQRIVPGRRGYELTLPAASAALVSTRLLTHTIS